MSHPMSRPPAGPPDPADPGESGEEALEMTLSGFTPEDEAPEGFTPVRLHTSRGDIQTRYYPPAAPPGLAGAGPGGRAVAPARCGVIFVGGAGGGFDTPVRGWLYRRLSEGLSAEDGLHALRLKYRYANYLEECTLDVLAGVEFLVSQGVRRAGLVGHSFGGAVVIQAAALHEAVVACASLSTQTYGAEPARTLGPRCALFLAHGQADQLLPAACTRHVFAAAAEPKEIHLHPTARHGLDEWADELPEMLQAWLRVTTGRAMG